MKAALKMIVMLAIVGLSSCSGLMDEVTPVEETPQPIIRTAIGNGDADACKGRCE